MLPILPFVIGGAIGTVAGIVAKTYYDENEDEIKQNLEEKISSIDEWLDEKLVALDKYKDSLYEDEEHNFSNSVEEEINLQSLQEMKKRVYHDSFSNFTDFYENIENIDLGKLEFKELDFSTHIFDEKIYDKTIQHNIKVTTDLLFKANNLLSDITLNLSIVLKDNLNYENFNIKEKELLKDAFSIAKFIQKICLSDDISEDVVVKFNNIISDIEEEL